MNKKFSKYWIICIILMHSIPAIAQRQEATTFFVADLPYTISGDYKYSYFIEENGKVCLDGPFSMIGAINKSFDGYKYWYTVKVAGKYNLKGSHKNGNLHGNMTFDAHLNLDASNGDNGSFKYSLKGNYNEGKPDGNFIVNYDGEILEKLNVTYDNGILVGPYYAYGYDVRSQFYEVKGTLNSEGELNGKWLIDKQNREFINGVEVGCYSTDLDSKARQYARGSITEGELRDDNIIVLTRSINLGERASDIILRDVIQYDNDHLGHYKFSESEDVSYKYLKIIPTISDDGFNLFMTDAFADSIENWSNYTMYDGLKDCLDYVAFDPVLKLYYLQLWENDKYSQYCKGYPKWTGGTKIYLSDTQVSTFRERGKKYLTDMRITESAIEVSEIDRFVKTVYRECLQRYMYIPDTHIVQGSINIYDTIVDSLKLSFITTIQNSFLKYSDRYILNKEISLADGFTNIYKASDKESGAIQYYTKEFWYAINVLNGQYDELISNTDSSEHEYINEIKVYLDANQKENIDIFQERISPIYSERKEVIIEHLNKTIIPKIDYLLNKKRSLDILYGAEAEKIFYEGELEYWELDVNKPLKKILPLISYEIIDVEVENEKIKNVRCSFVTYHKKGNTKREATINIIDNNKIYAGSLFDLCNAPGVLIE